MSPRQQKSCRVKIWIKLEEDSNKHCPTPAPPILALPIPVDGHLIPDNWPPRHWVFVTYCSKVAQWEAKPKPAFWGASLLVALMLPLWSSACTRPPCVCLRKRRETEKEEGKAGWATAVQEFPLTQSGTGWIKHHLCSVSFYMATPLPLLTEPSPTPRLPLVALTLPLCPHPSWGRSKADGGEQNKGVLQWMFWIKKRAISWNLYRHFHTVHYYGSQMLGWLGLKDFLKSFLRVSLFICGHFRSLLE